MRKTLIIALVLLLTAVAGGGTWSYYVWYHSDELLRTKLMERLEAMFPEWDIAVARARFDFQGRIHAHGFRLTTGADRERFLDVDEVILTIDGGRLADVDPLIRRIEFVRPRVWLVRDAEGEWNLHKLPPVKMPGGVLPAWSFERLSVSTRVERGDGAGEALQNDIDEAQLQVTPVGRRQYRLKLAGRSNRADVVRLDGSWHLDARSWQVRGNFGRLRIDDSAIVLASEFSPEFRGALNRTLDAIRDRFRTTEVDEETEPTARDFDMGVSVTSDVEVQLKQDGPGADLEYAAALQILEGELARPPVDFPITELRGRALFDNDRIVLEQLTARSGAISFSLPTGKIEEQNELRPARFELHLTEIPLDDRIVALLPPVPRKLYLEARPTGKVDAHVSVETDGASPWNVEWRLNPRDCTVRHVDFPYLVEGVEGEVSQRDGVIRVELKGIAGRQPLRMSGETTNPGPEAESSYEIVVDGLPIDPRLKEASPPALQKVIDALQIQGTIGGRVILKRPPGPKQPTIPSVDVTLRNATMTPRMFPYTLNRASARIRGSGKSWKFTNCKAWHDRTVITGSGDYRPGEDQKPKLSLKFSGEDVRFDRTLYESLPDDLRSLWYEVNPEGSAHLEGTLEWVAETGKRPRIELEAELLDVSVALRSFPYPIRNIHAWATVAPGKVTIRDFEGRHDETRLQTQATATVTDDGEWRFRCEPLTVDDLDAGMAFRRALPGALRTVVDAFDLRGGVSLSGMLELRGVRGDDYPVTAAWNLKTVYSGNTVTAGVELQEMHGKSQFTGTWDGEAVRANGKLSLNSVKVLGYQLKDVEGPIRIDDRQLVLGSKAVLERGNATEIPDGERLTAQFIDGVLAVDALIRLGEPMRYDLRVGLRNGLLERYNQLYMSGGGRLAGVTNGVLYLSGQGNDFRQLKGNGRLVIEPAALYDLPLLLAIFRVLSLQSADAAAFDRAQFDFNVRNGLVLFDRMNLQGESISLIGRGTVRMNDKRIKLDFYSASGRRQLPIPLIREITNELTKGWVGIHVEGTLRDPRPETRPIPVLDDALKRLLGVFDNRAPMRRP